MRSKESFFQKLSDSLTSLFPFNSTARENVSEVPFDNKLSPIRTSNRRVASVAFGKEEDESKIKRARLHYDLKSLPTSRIIKPNNTLQDKFSVYNNFNDTASELSETSNISVSTSGVSSLHPRSSKRLYLGNTEDISLNINSKYPRNLNVSQKIISPISNKSFKNAKEFISSPAKRILEKLDKLTTPITAADKLTTLLAKEKIINSPKSMQQISYSPYSRPIPPIVGKKPLPIKAVTISGSSNDNLRSNCGPIRSKHTKKMKRLGYVEDIDLDSESLNNNYDYPKLNEIKSNQLKFNNIPTLKKSISTNTEGDYFSNPLRSPSPDLEFTFRPPQTVNDEEYLSFHLEDTVKFQFKSKISEKERSDYHKRINVNMKSDKLWRCDTCFSENFEESLQCSNCGNISKKNSSTLILPKKTIFTEKSNVNEDLPRENSLDSTEENVTSKCSSEHQKTSISSGFAASEIKMDFSKLSSITTQYSTPVSCGSANVTSTSTIFNTKVEDSNINRSSPLEISNASVETSNSKCSKQSLFVDSNKELNNSTIGLSSTKPLSFGTTTESSSLSFGKAVDSTNTSSESSSLSKPLSFGQTVDTKNVSLSTKPFFEKTSESSSLSTAFSIGQVPITTTCGVSTASTNQSSELITRPDTSSLSSKPFSFSQPKEPEVKSSVTSSNGAAFLFGKLPNSEQATSSSFPASKSFSFGNISNAGENSTLSSSNFNQTSNTLTTFGQVPCSGDTSISNSQTATGTTISSGKTMFPSNQSFPFGQSLNATSNASSMFSTSSSNDKPFSFGQGLNNGETSTSKPSPFVFGQVSNSTVISTGNTNSKPAVLFGQTSNEGKSSTSSTFQFGQSSNTEQNSNIAQQQSSSSLFTNPGSSQFGGSSSSLFGNNSLSQSSHSGTIFGSIQTVTTTAPLATIEPSKQLPGSSSFTFNTQPMSVFGAQNTKSNTFSSTPQLNFSHQQPTVNQNPPQFSLPSNNNQTPSNMFGVQNVVQNNNPFQFGSSSSVPAGNNNTTFPNPATEQTGFNFNPSQQGLFQFSSGVNNAPNLSATGAAAANARRTLKSRRKLK